MSAASGTGPPRVRCWLRAAGAASGRRAVAAVGHVVGFAVGVGEVGEAGHLQFAFQPRRRRAPPRPRRGNRRIAEVPQHLRWISSVVSSNSGSASASWRSSPAAARASLQAWWPRSPRSAPGPSPPRPWRRAQVQADHRAVGQRRVSATTVSASIGALSRQQPATAIGHYGRTAGLSIGMPAARCIRSPAPPGRRGRKAASRHAHRSGSCAGAAAASPGLAIPAGRSGSPWVALRDGRTAQAAAGQRVVALAAGQVELAWRWRYSCSPRAGIRAPAAGRRAAPAATRATPWRQRPPAQQCFAFGGQRWRLLVALAAGVDAAGQRQRFARSGVERRVSRRHARAHRGGSVAVAVGAGFAGRSGRWLQACSPPATHSIAGSGCRHAAAPGWRAA